jgi:hypothetical protein
VPSGSAGFVHTKIYVQNTDEFRYTIIPLNSDGQTWKQLHAATAAVTAGGVSLPIT